jgi:hypothetical protein
VRVVALDTVHFALKDGMMLRKVKLRMGFEMALETGLWIIAGNDDEFAATAAGFDVPAAGTVTGFTALLTA